MRVDRQIETYRTIRGLGKDKTVGCLGDIESAEMKFLVFLWDTERLGGGGCVTVKPSCHQTTQKPLFPRTVIENKIKTQLWNTYLYVIPRTSSFWQKAFDIQLAGGISALQKRRHFFIKFLLLKTHSGAWGMALQPGAAASASLPLEAWGPEKFSEICTSENRCLQQLPVYSKVSETVSTKRLTNFVLLI